MGILNVFSFFKGMADLHIAFLFDVIILVMLFYKVHKNKKIIFTKDIKFIMILGWSISYLITCFYSPDTELAFLGFLKYFTVPLFLLLVMQYEYTEEEKNKWFDWIAKIGAIMISIILIVTIIEKITGSAKYRFFYQNRLSGFFNYANSFGLFLLIGIIVTGFKKKLKVLDFIISNLLLIGIILTNSRAIILITVFSYLLILIFNKEGRKKNFINFGILFLVGIGVVVFMNFVGVSNRITYMRFSLYDIWLRLLYYKDALKMIGKNIFGYGYMAWWYMQEGMQTGAYDIKFVHNSLLQVAVDVGVIPSILVVLVFIKGFFDKNVSKRDRVLMFVILGHSLIDFNIEFLSITLILFMTLHFDNKIDVKTLTGCKIGIIILFGVYIFFGTAVWLNEFGNYKECNKIFPYSSSLDNELSVEEEINNKVKIAETLYEKNKYFLTASMLLSEKEQYLGNYEKANEYEEWIIKNKKYTMKYYISYVKFLEKVIKHYYNEKDYHNMKKYIAKLENVPKIIENVKNTSDSLAYKIYAKPRLDMPIEMKKYIEQMSNFSKRIN